MSAHLGSAQACLRFGTRRRRLLLSLLPFFLACGGGTTGNPPKDSGPGQDPGIEVLPDVPDVPADTPEDRPSDTPDPGTPDLAEDTPALPDFAPEDLPPADLPPSCVEGKLCDDGDPCTHADVCIDGVCRGKPYTCGDGRDCTDDVCDGYGGCRYPIAAGRCLIHNVCFQAGESSAFSACVRCDPGVSATDFTLAPDGTPCGSDDPCLSVGQCQAGQCSGAPTGCDDEDPCTDDACTAGKGCVHTFNFEPCEDGDPCTLGDQCNQGACVTGFNPLDCDDGNPCTQDLCTPQGCSHANLTGPCDDDDVCTEGDACKDGACSKGEAVNCDDDNECTDDWCDPLVQCRHKLLDNPCCVGGTHICNDKNPCTKDICNPADGSCTHEALLGPCNDGNACTGPDLCGEDGACKGPEKTCDDANTCTEDSCNPKSGCLHKPLSGTCDDHNACTKDDACQPNGVCAGKAANCDDKNPCTKDSCTSDGGCSHEPTTGACNDKNVCTANDNCGTGTCQGTPVDCNDGNACTADSCHPAAGCQHQPVTGGCDDGSACTTGDHCQDGKCVGTPGGICCTPEFVSPVNKVVKLEIGEDGNPGNGLNVDGKANTCQPDGSCSAGIDNSMGPLSGMANDPLKDAMAKGEALIVFEHRGFNTTGTPYTFAFWEGKKSDPGCDIMTQSCPYLVTKDFLTTDCKPKYAFTNAKVTGTHMTAGGVGYGFPVQLPLGPGATLSVTLANAQVDATLTMSGGKPVAMKGLLAGAVPKAAIVEAVNSIPDDQLPAGLSKDAILTLLELIINNDIDTDGDKVLDAASIGLRFEAIGGSIVGVKP
jgi:hypothetical protein